MNMPEASIEYSTNEYRAQILNLNGELQNAQKQIAELTGEKLQLIAKLQAMRTQYREEIAEFQAKTHRGIDACVLILTEIYNSRSSHWQKKENIRLACEVLKKFKIEGNGFLPFAWEDDY